MDKIRIDLTEEQQKKIHDVTGKDAVAIDLSVEELEDRISPSGRRLSF